MRSWVQDPLHFCLITKKKKKKKRNCKMASWNRPLISKAIQVVLTYFSCNFCCLFLMHFFIPVGHSNKPWFLKDMCHMSINIWSILCLCHCVSINLIMPLSRLRKWFLSASKARTLEALSAIFLFLFFISSLLLFQALWTAQCLWLCSWIWSTILYLE